MAEELDVGRFVDVNEVEDLAFAKREWMSDFEIQRASVIWARSHGIRGDVIGVFSGDTRFLSNFYVEGIDSEIEEDALDESFWKLFDFDLRGVRGVSVYGYEFVSAENAYQASKCWDRVEEFLSIRPKKAKRLGKKLATRVDFDEVKDELMYEVVLAKFEGYAELREKLLATGDAYLIEGNWWNDRYWGVCRGVGENRLGKILMRVRYELGNE